MEGKKLYVGNFKYNTTEEQLKELFAEYGEVVKIDIIGDKGFGFVEMSDSSEAEKAKEALNETDLDGRTLRVDEAKPQKPRTDRRY
ncbi:MAG: RNA-binding protein [Actinobacteria bacterium]|jgi:RNA recognition motif-containing protein|nr:RNA-binding protein [Actinomycetota bacterium]